MPHRLLLVLGMHRSGTSALAGLLGQAGFALPTSTDPGDGNNHTGYWEPRAIRTVHNRLLDGCQSSWHDPLLPVLTWQPQRLDDTLDQLEQALAEDFAGMPADGVAVVKDPRQCRLMPLWWELLQRRAAEVHVLLVVRRPEAVAASLGRRDQLPQDRALLLWLSHTLEAELHSRALPRLVLSYEALLREPAAMVRACQQLAGLPEQELSPELLDHWIRPQLNHAAEGDGLATAPEGHGLLELATAVYEALCSEALQPAARQHRLDQAMHQVQGMLAALPRQGGQRALVELFWEPQAGGGFGQEHSQRQPLLMEHNRMAVTFVLPAQAARPRALRLDPAAQPGLLTVQRLELRDAAGELLWHWSGAASAPPLQAATPGTQVLGGGLVLAADGDPGLVLPIPAGSLARVDSGSSLRVQAFWQALPADLAHGLLASVQGQVSVKPRPGRGWLRKG
jgi:hypothetical protein